MHGFEFLTGFSSEQQHRIQAWRLCKHVRTKAIRRAFLRRLFNVMHFKACRTQMASVFLRRLSSPVCSGWPHPNVRGQPSPATQTLEIVGVRVMPSVERDPSGKRHRAPTAERVKPVERLANAHRNTSAHFSQDSHKSANNNNKKWEREQVFEREREREMHYYRRFTLLKDVECWQ